MESDAPEIMDLPEEETVTVGAPHPGLSVFQMNNALRYFNKEFILKEELEEDNTELYLENSSNICFAMEKIFDKQVALSVKTDSTPRDEAKTPHTRLDEGAIKFMLSKHAQLIKRFRLDLSLAESDMDSSFCVSLSSSVTNTPSKSQEESKANTANESGEVTTYSSASLDEDCDISADLVSLFWLMSALPEPAASKCKQVMDRDQFAWKISVYDVILVMLNWGATLQSLRLEDISAMPSSLFAPQLSSPYSLETNKEGSFPLPFNVDLVLNSISQRLPRPVSPRMPCSHRALLVKVLVYAALDHAHRRYLAQYCRTIRSVLESYLPWGPDEASVIVSLLQLEGLVLQNSMFVCCSLFNMTSSRLSLVGLLASHNVLHRKFGLPAEPSFSELIRHLLYPPELLNKFRLWHVYIITCLVHSLLVRNACQTPPCSQETVAGLHQWTVEVRSALTQYPYMYSLASGHVRERLSRLAAECATVMRTMHSNSVNKTYD